MDETALIQRSLAATALDYTERFDEQLEIYGALGPDAAHDIAMMLIDQDEDHATSAGFDLLKVVVAYNPSEVPLLVSIADKWLDAGLPSQEAEWALAHSLAGNADPAIAPVLARLAYSQNPETRFQVAAGLPVLITAENRSKFEPILALLSSDPDPDVAAYAKRALDSNALPAAKQI